MLLIYLSCAWVVGIFLGSICDVPLVLILIGLIPLPFLFFLRSRRKTIILTSLCIITLFGGVFRFQSSVPVVDENYLQHYNDQRIVEVKGIVAEDPEVRDKTIHLRLSATEIKVGNDWQEVSGTALLFVPRYPAYRYGDVLQTTGKLETPSQLDNFDYQAYLARQGIHSIMFYPEIEILASGQGFKPLEWVYSLRNHLSQILAEVLPEPQASFAQGIILGIRGTIPQSIKDNLTYTGTAHLLAISGINLSIVAGILLSIGTWLFGRRRHIYIWLALSVIWLYSLLTGMQPPVVRSSIMASLFLTADLLGRQRSAITPLAFAAAIMIGITPQVLWMASFQMSFLAMAGLIFIAPPLMTSGRKAANQVLGEGGVAGATARAITDSFSITLGAIIAIWPVIAYYFGIISFVGPLATLLAVLALPAIIITGTLVGVLGFIALPIAKVIGWIAWLFLSYMLLIVNGFASLPLSSAEVGSVSSTLMWVYYPVLAVALWLNANRKRLTNLIPETAVAFLARLSKKWVILPLLVVAVLVLFTATTMPDDNLHVSFLDVGEGDAVLIQTPSHQDILVDGGPSPQAVCQELSKKMPFWDRTVDLVILTHPHTDHLTGLVEVLRRYYVKQVLAPDLDYESPLYDELLNLIREKNIEYTTAQAGQQVNLGDGAVIKVLNPWFPPLTDTQSDIDNNGVVFRLSLGEVSFLLTADIMQEAELELIQRRADLTSTVLKVAHHGADTSTCPGFLAAVNPHLAVISVGEDNRFGHPNDEVISRLKEKLAPEYIYRTDKHGTIEFITNGERLWVKTGLR